MKKQSRKRTIEDDFEDIESMRTERDFSILKSLNYKINLKFKNKKQKDYYNILKDNRIIFVKGSAGTGKTIIALLLALELLKSKEMRKIVISKPIVEASNSIGFLPGDIASKTSIYMNSFMDNIEKIIGREWTKTLKDNNIISDVALNYMRGNTLNGVDMEGNPVGYFCILDEAQNCTKKDIKLFLSRMGEKSKLCILGDQDQSDLKLGRDEKSGLDDAWERFQDLPGVGFMEFDEDDIVRDPFLIAIMKRYNNKKEN